MPVKQGQQGPQKLISLKSLKIQNFHRFRAFSLLQPTELASFSNSRWENLKERPNQSTNKGDMVDKAKRDVASGRSVIYIITEELSL